VIDLTNLDNKNKAATKFLQNLERECVEEQCGLEEAIETYEEFGARAAANVISGDQQKYDKYKMLESKTVVNKIGIIQ